VAWCGSGEGVVGAQVLLGWHECLVLSLVLRLQQVRTGSEMEASRLVQHRHHSMKQAIHVQHCIACTA
jgi:hypothetical protein